MVTIFLFTVLSKTAGVINRAYTVGHTEKETINPRNRDPKVSFSSFDETLQLDCILKRPPDVNDTTIITTKTIKENLRVHLNLTPSSL